MVGYVLFKKGIAPLELLWCVNLVEAIDMFLVRLPIPCAIVELIRLPFGSPLVPFEFGCRDMCIPIQSSTAAHISHICPFAFASFWNNTRKLWQRYLLVEKIPTAKTNSSYQRRCTTPPKNVPPTSWTNRGRECFFRNFLWLLLRRAGTVLNL